MVRSGDVKAAMIAGSQEALHAARVQSWGDKVRSGDVIAGRFSKILELVQIIDKKTPRSINFTAVFKPTSR